MNNNNHISPAICGKERNNNLGITLSIRTNKGGFGLAFLFTSLGFKGRHFAGIKDPRCKDKKVMK